MVSRERIEQAGGEAVGQQGRGHVERTGVRVAVLWAVETVDRYLDERDLGLDLVVAGAMDIGHGHGLLYRGLAGRDTAERALEKRLDRRGVDVAGQNQAHVIAHVVLMEKVHHLAQARVLQVLGAADDLERVGVAVGEDAYHLHERGFHGVVGCTVLLLVDRLKLALEEAEDRVNHAVAVEFAPLSNVLRGEGVEIIGIVV